MAPAPPRSSGRWTTLASLGGEALDIDYAPFREAARLLYDGPWLAERHLAIGAFHGR